MHKKLLKPFNTIKSRILFNTAKKNIYYNPKVGYYVNILIIQAPSEEDYVKEIKEWLTVTNHQLLCVYFCNDWNPVSLKAEEGYKDFVKKNSKVAHLKINSDKFPKLRWFFDAKVILFLF